MHVLHVYRTYFPDPAGGIQEAIRQIAVSTMAHGAEPKVFTLSPCPIPTEIHRPESTVIRCKSWLSPASCDVGGITAFQQFARAAKWADVIHYHFPWPFADLMHLTMKPTCPAIMTYHSDIVRQQFLGSVYSPLMERMLSQMKAIVATSPTYAKTSRILSDESVNNRVKVIPLGVEESTYPARGDNRVLSRLGLMSNEPFFLSLGVLRYYKGLHTLVAAASQVKAKIVIAGSGPEAQPIGDEVKRLGLTNVICAGQVTEAEKVALLKHCRSLVLPSHLRSEAFGVVLVEASMYSKPMISCEIGTGTSYVNKHGSTGVVVPPGSPSALAEAMNMLLENIGLADRYGQTARQRYEALFSGQAMGKAYARLYSEVLHASA